MGNSGDRFLRTLYEWYDENARQLPWRETNDPYKIWLSEIILQQTQVVQGTNYYYAFVKTYPTVQQLSEAPLDDVLKLWQGLGYYSRAHNLHWAAQQVMNEFDGHFPNNYSQLLQLKGVGKYTAAAVASIAFGEPKAVVDGNVYRFLSRYFLIDLPVDTTEGINYFARLAQQLIPSSNPGRHNQAMMEFGALQCSPHPQCNNCPLIDACGAFDKQLVGLLPVKSKKVKSRNRYFVYLCMIDGDNIYLHQRVDNDIWKNLYELPMLEYEEDMEIMSILNSSQYQVFIGDVQCELLGVTNERLHILTHQRLHAKCVYLKLNSRLKHDSIERIRIDDVDRYAVPRLVEYFLEDIYKYV